MPRKMTAQTPTDEEIMAYNNVPVDVAAKYIGWSSCRLTWELQQERAPFGMAAQTGTSGKTGLPTWVYNISPGLLIKYKPGHEEPKHTKSVLRLDYAKGVAGNQGGNHA